MVIGYIYPNSSGSSVINNSCIHRVFKCVSHRSDFIQSSQSLGLPVTSNTNIQGVNDNSRSNHPSTREFEGRGVSIGATTK